MLVGFLSKLKTIQLYFIHTFGLSETVAVIYNCVKYYVFHTDKFIQYDIALPNQDRTMVEPHAMVLESELLQHHYVHWDVPSLEVKCQVNQIHN